MWAVLGKFFQSLPVPCGVLCRRGGAGLSVCVSVTVSTQLTADGPGTGEVQWSDGNHGMKLRFHGWDETAPQGSVYLVSSFFPSPLSLFLIMFFFFLALTFFLGLFFFFFFFFLALTFFLGLFFSLFFLFLEITHLCIMHRVHTSSVRW